MLDKEALNLHALKAAWEAAQASAAEAGNDEYIDITEIRAAIVAYIAALPPVLYVTKGAIDPDAFKDMKPGKIMHLSKAGACPAVGAIALVIACLMARGIR